MAANTFLTLTDNSPNTVDVTTQGLSFEVVGDTSDMTFNVADGAGVENLDEGSTINLSGSLSDYNFGRNGTNLIITDGSGNVVAEVNETSGDTEVTTIRFADGSAQVGVDATTGLLTFAGQSLADGDTVLGTEPTLAVDDPTDVSPVSVPVGPNVSVSAAAASVTEGSDAVFTVELSAAQGTETTVDFVLAGTGSAVLGTDTTTVADATLTFAPGETTKVVTVPVTFDNLDETGEGMTLTLSNPSTGIDLGTATSSVSFEDPAAPTYTLTSDAATQNKEGDTVTFTVTPSSVVVDATSFNYSITGNDLGGAADKATAGDFSAASGSISFAAGDTAAKTVSVTLALDNVDESLEGYTFNLLDSSTSTVVDSETGQILDSSGSGGAGQSLTLTTGQDTILGTENNDTIKGSTSANNTSGNNTFTAADTIDGGAGTDTLEIVVEAGTAAQALPVATISNVEIFDIRNTNTAAPGGANVTTTVDAANFTGETNINNDRGTGGTGNIALAVTNLSTGAAAGIAGDGVANITGLNFGYQTATADAVLNITDGVKNSTVGATPITVTSTPANLTINSTNTANTTTNEVDGINAGGAVTALTINADSAFRTTGIVGLNGAGATIDVNGSTTGSVTLGALQASVGGLNASDMTAGGVSATLNALPTITVVGGEGADRFTTGALLTTGSVNAAGGTDTLIVASDAHMPLASQSTVSARYTNFETLGAQDGVVQIDMDNMGSGYTGLWLNGGAVGITITDATATQAANVAVANAGAGAINIGVKGATIGGQMDTVNIAAATAANPINLSGLTMAGVETLTITGNATASTQGAVTLTTGNSPALTSVTLTNAGNGNAVTVQAANTAKNLIVDASASTGTTTINGAAYAATTGMTLKGGSAADVLTGSNLGDIISTGTGADTVMFQTNGNAVNMATPIVDTVSDFTLGSAGDKLDLTNSGVAQNGTTNSVLVTSLTSALPTAAPGNTAELIILDSSVAALQAATPQALNNLLFNLGGSGGYGTVLVAYAADATSDVHIATATIAGGDITNITDGMVLTGVTTSSLNSGFHINNLTNFAGAAATGALTATAPVFTAATAGSSNVTGGNFVVGSANTITSTGAQLAGSTITGSTGSDTLIVSDGAAALMTTLASVSSLENVRLDSAHTGFTADATAGLTIVDNNQDANTVTLGALTQNFTGGTGVSIGNNTLNIPAGSYTGTASGGTGGNDNLALAAFADISGNTNISGFESVTLAGQGRMTLAQHNGFTTVTGGTVNLADAGAITNAGTTSNYNLADGVNSITQTAVGQVITGGTGVDTVTAITNVTAASDLGGGANVVVVGAGVDVDNAGANPFSATGGTVGFNVTGATATMNSAQIDLITSTTGVNNVTVGDAVNFNAVAGVETYTFGAQTATVPATNLGVNFVGGAGNETVAIAGQTVTGTSWALAGGTDVITASTGANISAVNGGAVTSAETLTLANGSSITMTQAQHAAFVTGTITAAGTTAGGDAETIILSDANAAITADPAVENYRLANGTNGFTFATLADGLTATVTTTGTGADTINVTQQNAGTEVTTTVTLAADAVTDSIVITNTTLDAGLSVTTVNGFTLANDTIKVSEGGTVQTGGLYTEVAAGSNTTISVLADSVIEITGSAIADFTSDAAVATALAGAINGSTAGNYTAILYGNGNAAIYNITDAGTNADALAADFTGIELIGVINNVALDALGTTNFVA